MTYSIKKMALATALIAIGIAAMLNESRWVSSSLWTIAHTALIASLVCSIFSVGERRAFALGFFATGVSCLLSAYTFGYSLPYLIIETLYENLESNSSAVPSEDHFTVVAGVLWGISFAWLGGLAAIHWHRESLAAVRQSGGVDASQ